MSLFIYRETQDILFSNKLEKNRMLSLSLLGKVILADISIGKTFQILYFPFYTKKIQIPQTC